ncbi:MAG: MliC family protein [Roseobacter sp.]
MRAFLIVLGFVLWVCAASFAPAALASIPSFDCAKAASSAETLICSDVELANLDIRLAGVFKRAERRAEGLDAGAQEAAQRLRVMQRGWIKGRDACWTSTDLRQCVQDAYLTREGELVAQWLLEKPISTVIYRCDAAIASEVSAFFFDTPRPSIRLEYSDRILVGSVIPSASGAKYATGFGTFFWSKENTGLFSWQEGKETPCVAFD